MSYILIFRRENLSSNSFLLSYQLCTCVCVPFVAADLTFSNLALLFTPLIFPSLSSFTLHNQTKAPRFIIWILAIGDPKWLQLKQFVLMQSSINRLLIVLSLICLHNFIYRTYIFAIRISFWNLISTWYVIVAFISESNERNKYFSLHMCVCVCVRVLIS